MVSKQAIRTEILSRYEKVMPSVPGLAVTSEMPKTFSSRRMRLGILSGIGVVALALAIGLPLALIRPSSGRTLKLWSEIGSGTASERLGIEGVDYPASAKDSDKTLYVLLARNGEVNCAAVSNIAVSLLDGINEAVQENTLAGESFLVSAAFAPKDETNLRHDDFPFSFAFGLAPLWERDPAMVFQVRITYERSEAESVVDKLIGHFVSQDGSFYVSFAN